MKQRIIAGSATTPAALPAMIRCFMVFSTW